MRTVSIQVSDEDYNHLAKLAKVKGFGSVDALALELVENELEHESANFDHVFTPEVIAHLDDIVASLDAGEKTLTPKQVDERLAATKAAWLKENAG